MDHTNVTFEQIPDPHPIDRVDIIGNLVQGAAYGCHICVFITTLYFIGKSRPHSKKIGIAFAVLTCALFALGSCQIVIGEILDEMAWVDHRNFPGGPMAWIGLNLERTIGIIQNVAYIVANFLADGSMIYRLYVIWDGNVYVLAVPVLAYLATIALAIVSLIQMEQPSGSLSSHAAIEFFVPFWFLAISLNVLLTSLIVLRLLYMRRRILGVLGAEHSIPYISIIAILVESSAIFAATGLIYIVCFEVRSPFQSIALGVLDQCVCIAPELIVLRAAQGHAWTRNSNREVLSSLKVRAQESTNTGQTLESTSQDRINIGNIGTALELASPLEANL